jgi:hypothetical protein
MAKVHSTTKHKLQIAELLAKHLKPHEKAAGQFVYDGDFTDEYIAKLVGDGLNDGHVGRIRLELYGPLYRVPPVVDDARVTAMQTVIEKLTAELADLNGRHNKLCQTLALNRVADVRHLSNETAALVAIPPRTGR